MSVWTETDIGLIPVEWDIKTVDEIKSKNKKAIISGPFGSNISAKFFVKTGVPVIRGNNLSLDINKKFIDNGFVFITEEKANELGTWAEKDDIVFTAVGTIGQVGILLGKERFDKYIISNKQLRLKVDENIVEPLYAYYWFASPLITDIILQRNTGSSVPLINLSVLKSLLIPLPSKKERIGILKILSSLDDKIDLLQRQNSTLEAMAETLFRQWFVEEAKEEWETKKLKEIVLHVKPGTNYQPQRVATGIPFLNVRNLKNGFLDLSDTTFITIDEYKRVHKVWQPEENDILISRIGTLGEVAAISKRDLPVAVHYNMINLKAKSTSFQFLYFLLKSNYFQEIYFANVRQSVQEYVAIEDVENIDIKLPFSSEDFKEKEKTFVQYFTKISSNESQIRTLTTLRDVLLPKLMSGEVRVVV